MRTIAFVVLLLSSGVHAQVVSDAFEITQRFANSGAPQLALARIEQLQPATSAAPRWDEWEKLRCELMLRLDRHRELVQRVTAMPAGVSGTAARYCLLRGARAAIAGSLAPVARDLLARLLWRLDTSADEMREVRRLVIESYVAENKTQDAYVLMLRYQQDYRPVDGDTAARFVDALLSAGMEKEAVNWYSQLDEASPAMLRMRLASRQIAPDAAIAQARASLARPGNTAAWWMVLRQAAALQGDTLLQAEALENLVQLSDGKMPGQLSAIAAELWKFYIAAAQEIANKDLLLQGDDANWADYASRRMGSSPVMARAFYAHLARNSKNSSTRQNAQLQLVFSLQGSKLGLTALHLFDDTVPFPVAQLDGQVRYLLGMLALDSDNAVAAARYWQGLAAPAGVESDEWQVRLAQTLVRAGAAAAGADALRALVAGRKSLPAAMIKRAIAPVQDLQDAGQARIADEMFRALLPLAEARERREILSGLGRIAESNQDFRYAAACFLEAALLADGRTPDVAAIDARIAAASNLGRAGLKDDARAQFDWLQKNVKDTEKQELIRREKQKL